MITDVSKERERLGRQTVPFPGSAMQPVKGGQRFGRIVELDI
jgi:hypothetical protein